MRNKLSRGKFSAVYIFTMSQLNWSGVLAALVGAVTVGLIAGGYHFGYRLGEDAGNSVYSAEYHDNYATDRIERECIGNNLTGFELRECMEEQVKDSYEYQTAYNGLKSQERMAFWAVLMGVFTGLNVLVTGVGVVYVAKTLRATSDTLDATRVMASDQKRIGDSQVAASNEAVSAAREANRVAAQQFRSGFKPWISVEVKGPFFERDQLSRFAEGESLRPILLSVSTVIHCVGDIPATIEEFDLRMLGGKDWPYVINPQNSLKDGGLEVFSILQNGQSIHIDPRGGIIDNPNDWPPAFSQIELTPENRRSFMKNPPPIIGKIIYSDPMGTRYLHNFAFVSTFWGAKFKRYGGIKYNSEREIS